MKYNTSANDDEVCRTWTEQIPGNIVLTESNNVFSLTFIKYKGPWHHLILGLGRIQAFLEFIETTETGEEISLGENDVDGELTVRYQDGTYILDSEKKDVELTLTEDQGDAIYDLLQHIDTVV